jgi:hypothetical protein
MHCRAATLVALAVLLVGGVLTAALMYAVGGGSVQSGQRGSADRAG